MHEQKPVSRARASPVDSRCITVLVDNDSWIIPHAHRLVEALNALGYSARFAARAEDVQPGWITFLLGCTKLVPAEVLKRNRHNLVVHESDLPQGRGFAPIAWQILEGKNIIPMCLLEAAEEPDAGDIWLRDSIRLAGNELCDEWRLVQGDKTVEMCLRFVREYKHLRPVRQCGTQTWYPRRRAGDSRLDPMKSLADQFNLLRVVDNNRYPAFFEIDGETYTLSITRGVRGR